MIDVYYWGTPNGLKIKLFLEEAGRDFATSRFRPGATRRCGH
jgi:hypothetical protein